MDKKTLIITELVRDAIHLVFSKKIKPIPNFVDQMSKLTIYSEDYSVSICNEYHSFYKYRFSSYELNKNIFDKVINKKQQQ